MIKKEIYRFIKFNKIRKFNKNCECGHISFFKIEYNNNHQILYDYCLNCGKKFELTKIKK